MMPHNNKAIPVTESKLLALLDLYNDLLTTNFHIRGGTEEYKYHKSIPSNKSLYDTYFYQDLLNLYSIITNLKVRPLSYIMFQIKNYRPPTNMSRHSPTLKMLTTPAAVEKWENQFATPKHAISEADNDAVNAAYLKTLCQANGIEDENEIYKDPILISQISKSFLLKQPIFKKLLTEGYYWKAFKLKTSDII